MALMSGNKVINMRDVVNMPDKERRKYTAIPPGRPTTQENDPEPVRQNIQRRSKTGVNYNVLSHLKKILALLSVYEALILSKDLGMPLSRVS